MITSGPWRWVDRYNGRQHRLMGTGSDVPVLIASSVKERDGAAIRAVPDLLAALKAAAEELPFAGDRALPTLRIVLAAIALAEGGAA